MAPLSCSNQLLSPSPARARGCGLAAWRAGREGWRASPPPPGLLPPPQPRSRARHRHTVHGARRPRTQNEEQFVVEFLPHSLLPVYTQKEKTTNFAETLMYLTLTQTTLVRHTGVLHNIIHNTAKARIRCHMTTHHHNVSVKRLTR